MLKIITCIGAELFMLHSITRRATQYALDKKVLRTDGEKLLRTFLVVFLLMIFVAMSTDAFVFINDLSNYSWLHTPKIMRLGGVTGIWWALVDHQETKKLGRKSASSQS